jgi:Raf kinase inhibitor-like YbhB/YbcL family protein
MRGGAQRFIRLLALLFLTHATAARSIASERDPEGVIRNYRVCFEKYRCFAPVLCGALLLVSLIVDWPARAHGLAPESMAQKTADAKMQLTSSSFVADGAIPAQYTCDGADVSPALAWTEPPAGTQSFALIVDDPDAPKKTVIHWLLYDLPPATRALPEGIPTKPKLPDGSRQGKNDHGKIGYSGPCPPPGPAHHYFFKLYALDYKTGLKPKAKVADVETAIKGHILAQTQFIARFQH